MKKNYSRYIGAGFVLIILVLFFLHMEGYLGKQIHPGRQSEVPAEAEFSETSAVVMESVEEFDTAVGTITSNKETTIASKIAAHVLRILIRPGQEVTRDELLMELDPRDTDARLGQAKSNHSAAQAAFDQARSTYERYSKLISGGAATKAEFENAEAQYQTAAAKLNEILDAIKELEIMKDYTEIRAPYNGVIVDKLIDIGDLATPGTPLIKMQDSGGLRLEVFIPESRKEAISLSKKLSIKIDGIAEDVTGIVSEIIPNADPRTRSFLARINLDPSTRLSPGMFGRCYLPLPQKDKIFVDARAVYRVGQLEMVKVKSGDIIETRLVRVGSLFNGRYEVISGLEPGETVLLMKEQNA